MQYFTSLKIEEAKKLISFDKYTFTEIAYKLGYSSLHYFSRQFKRPRTCLLPNTRVRSRWTTFYKIPQKALSGAKILD